MVRLTVEGGVTVPLVVTLVGKGGVARARAEGRVMKKVNVCRLNFIVTVVKIVQLLKNGKNGGEWRRMVKNGEEW